MPSSLLFIKMFQGAWVNHPLSLAMRSTQKKIRRNGTSQGIFEKRWHMKKEAEEETQWKFFIHEAVGLTSMMTSLLLVSAG